MEMITVHESKSTLEDIDNLVKRGEFTSRAEVYRMGALLLATRPEVRTLAKRAQLDPMIFRNHIKQCLDAIEKNIVDKIQDKLHFVIDGMIFRELLSSVLSEENERAGFETIREGITMYEKTLPKINEMEENERKSFLNGLKRDLSALQYYVEQTGTMKDASLPSARRNPRQANALERGFGVASTNCYFLSSSGQIIPLGESETPLYAGGSGIVSNVASGGTLYSQQDSSLENTFIRVMKHNQKKKLR